MTDAEIDAEEAAAGVATQKAEGRYQQVEEVRPYLARARARG